VHEQVRIIPDSSALDRTASLNSQLFMIRARRAPSCAFQAGACRHGPSRRGLDASPHIRQRAWSVSTQVPRQDSLSSVMPLAEAPVACGAVFRRRRRAERGSLVAMRRNRWAAAVSGLAARGRSRQERW